MSDEALRKHMALQQANQHKFKVNGPSMETNNNPKALSSIDEIFTRLKAIGSVGNAFKTAQEEAIVKQEWMLALREEGVTKQHMIDDGIDSFRVKARNTRGTAWFPSIGEFISMCLGSENKLEYAARAYDLFINQERQIDNVGQIVIGRHGFELKTMKAAGCKKHFELYYLKYAESNKITTLDAFSLTDGVSLSPEQEKAAQARTLAARDEFLASVGQLIGKPVIEPIKISTKKAELTTGKIKTSFKSQRQMSDERDRQLAAVNHLLNKG